MARVQCAALVGIGRYLVRGVTWHMALAGTWRCLVHGAAERRELLGAAVLGRARFGWVSAQFVERWISARWYLSALFSSA